MSGYGPNRAQGVVGVQAATINAASPNADLAKEFIEKYVGLVETVVDGYLREGKRFMTIAVGCTGGKHRSVAMTEEIAARLRDRGIDARPMHRDLGRE